MVTLHRAADRSMRAICGTGRVVLVGAGELAALTASKAWLDAGDRILPTSDRLDRR